MKLWEDDISDDYVGGYEGWLNPFVGRDYVFRDIGKYVDGTHAEFYSKASNCAHEKICRRYLTHTL
jgi:hypothetical protein